MISPADAMPTLHRSPSLVSPGRFVSRDGLRQFRLGAHELRGTRPHAHFEAYNKPAGQGGRVVENTWVDIVGPG